jgi:hypothetical protein
MKKLIFCLLVVIAVLQDVSCYGSMFVYMKENPEKMFELKQLERAYRNTDKYKEFDEYDMDCQQKLGKESDNLNKLFEECATKRRDSVKDSQECSNLAAAWVDFGFLQKELQVKINKKKLKAEQTPEFIAYFRKHELFYLEWKLSLCEDEFCQD